MAGKKISVYFNMLTDYGYPYHNLNSLVSQITPSQARQIMWRLDNLPYPMNRYGLCKMKADMSGNELHIGRLFDGTTLEDEGYIMMRCTGEWCNCPTVIHGRCVQNFIEGKCENAYMRHAVGEILFPHLYQKQKQR